MTWEFVIPERFKQTMAELNGAVGIAWLERLPVIVADCARRWSLEIGAPFELTYNYVVPARRDDGVVVVLKVVFPSHELFTEVESLQIFDGRGMVRLLEVDLDQGALLLERLEPGTSLSSLTERDDEGATAIAADIMRRLWRPVPAEHRFPSVADWVLRMERLAPEYVEPHSAFPVAWIDRAMAIFNELMAAPVAPVLLHGDLHHGNILAAQREPWLAIDPKGVIGEPLCETEPFLKEALPARLDTPEGRRMLNRRADQLAEALEQDRDRLRGWGVVRAVLSAYWSLEDHGYGWERALLTADVLGQRPV